MEPNAQEGSVAQPSFWFRLWRWWGFKYPHPQVPDDENSRYVTHRFTTSWDWGDRLRILVSGKTELTTVFIYQGPVIFHAMINSNAGVLPPNAVVQKGW